MNLRSEFFLTFLDKSGIRRTSYIDFPKDNLYEIKGFSKKPIFDIGQDGTFDENGSLTCSLVMSPFNESYSYYAGF